MHIYVARAMYVHVYNYTAFNLRALFCFHNLAPKSLLQCTTCISNSFNVKLDIWFQSGTTLSVNKLNAAYIQYISNVAEEINKLNCIRYAEEREETESFGQQSL